MDQDFNKKLPMDSLLLEQLSFLYGDSTAESLLPRLRAVMGRYPLPAIPGSHSSRELPLNERNSLLIAYADQVREKGKAPLQTLGDFAGEHLGGVVSGIHILPFYPSSSDDGFSVKDYYQVDPDFGTWGHIEHLADRFELMFDAVFNHASAQGVWFKKFCEGDPAFKDFFVAVEGEPSLSQVVRPRALPLLTPFKTAEGEKKVWTTFSADQVDLNVKNPEVLLALVDALLFYVKHGARYIRLDAIAFLWKEIGTHCIHLPETHRIVQLMRAVLNEVAPQVLLVTETNVPHKDNISYFGDGTNEAQLVYNFALPPLTLYSLLSGDGTHLTRWAQILHPPSPRVTFFNFLASHDGIGLNPARGILTENHIGWLVEKSFEHGGLAGYKNNPDGSQSPYELNITYFDALSNPQSNEPLETQVNRFMVAHAIMLSLAGMPGIYFHSLFGSRNDRAAADASGIPRRINRQKLDRADLERDLSDPQSLRSRVFRGISRLLHARQSSPAFNPVSKQHVLSLGESTFALTRTAPTGESILCLHNLVNHSVEVNLEPVTSSGERWENIFTQKVFGSHQYLKLQPYEVMWARRL